MIFSEIEGATPINDESDLLQTGIISFKQLCDAEAENILKALRLADQGDISKLLEFTTSHMQIE